VAWLRTALNDWTIQLCVLPGTFRKATEETWDYQHRVLAVVSRVLPSSQETLFLPSLAIRIGLSIWFLSLCQAGAPALWLDFQDDVSRFLSYQAARGEQRDTSKAVLLLK